MSILKDLLALKPIAEDHDYDELEAAHVAQADEFHSRGSSSHDDAPVLASADEFQVEVDGDDVVLLDGEQTVRLTMPRHVWMDLCRQSLEAE